MQSRLPTLCRWFFAACTVLSVIGAIAIAAVIIIDPVLPETAQFNTSVDLTAPNGKLVVKTDSGAQLTVTQLQANVTGKDLNPVLKLFKQYGLPLGLVYTVFFAALFDLLRRLFRNVERGSSFTPQTVRLVRTIGYSLIIFSLASAVAEGVLASALVDYFRAHMVLTGPNLQWTAETGRAHFDFPFGNSQFFTGLLVLALAEVFRQGLKLKNDADLTI